MTTHVNRTAIALVTAGLIAAVLLFTALVTFGRVGAQTTGTLSLDIEGLEALEAGHYEGWAIFGEEKVSTGKFAISDGGALQTLSGDAVSEFEVERDLTAADQIVITIEPDGDTDGDPSGIVVLAGPVSGDTASLGFPVDLSGISGGYILATPTDDDDTNELAGVWFLDPEGPAPALSLPALPGGWVYEGWGVTQGTPLSSGRFDGPEGADFDDPFSGPNAGPQFPGEDFLANLPDAITPPVNLADGSSVIVISIEPDLDGVDPTGAGPFSIKPLVAPVEADFADHILAGMDANPSSIPSGSARLSDSSDAPTALPSTGSGGLTGESGVDIWAIAALAAFGAVVLGAAVRVALARR